MAKLTLIQVASAFESTQAVNSNYALIEAAVENTLSRDGATPNSMNANLDMNGFTILNTTAIFPAESITNTPEGNIAATDVQAAINELDVEKPQIFDGQTGAPTINDDILNGFKKGDQWIDETNDAAYTSVDESTGAAVWIQQGTDTGTVTSVGATAPITSSGGANPTVGIVAATGSVPGSMSAADKTKLDANLNTKIIDIGDWDMLASASVTVAHGLTLGNIRTISALIRNDAATASYDIAVVDNSSLTTDSEGSASASSSLVTLKRLGNGGFFAQTIFSNTSYNRGWITIQYID